MNEYQYAVQREILEEIKFGKFGILIAIHQNKNPPF